ncbi:hypothetical protein LWI28_020188 [Acer negundo]|uniref:Uncharacterized protein n=1 Tax=Acer negundo TaxID=4023 RepID=A0AAD5NX97_ACENE|nr:hypothetical protein LWI28_020188 [Acer negundo]
MSRSKIVDLGEASGSTNPRVPERGIDVSELEGTQVPGVVQARRWEDFVLNPPPYNEQIVREFYAGMIVEDYYKGNAVMVRGKPVRIQAADINRYHKTTLENLIPTEVEHQNLFGIHKSKKGPETTDDSSKSGRKKKRTVVEDDDRWYSEAALHDDVDTEGGFEEGVPRGGTSRNPVERILAAIKTSQDANQVAI